MSKELMVAFCTANMVICFCVFAIIYFNNTKNTQTLRSKPFFKNLEVKFSNYKQHLKQADQALKIEMAKKYDT